MKGFRKVVIACLLIALSAVPTFAMSKATRAQKALQAYKHKDYQAFDMYSRGLPRYGDENAVLTGQQYNIYVKAGDRFLYKHYGGFVPTDSGIVNVYGDKTAEMILRIKNTSYQVFTLKNGKVKHIGSFSGKSTYLFVVPGKKGIYQAYQRGGREYIRHITFRNGKAKATYVIRPRKAKKIKRMRYKITLIDYTIDYD